MLRSDIKRRREPGGLACDTADVYDPLGVARGGFADFTLWDGIQEPADR